MPLATCALVVPSDSESQAGMDSMRSVGPVLVDVEVAGPSSCTEPRDGFLDLKKILYSVLHIIDDRSERERFLNYISGAEMAE